jgi:hypothetical protein
MNNWDLLLEVLIAPFGPVALIALAFLLDLYFVLSRRLGEVTRMRPYYRRFWIAGLFVGLATVVQVLRTAAHISQVSQVAFLLSPVFSIFAFHLPLLLGVVVGILTAWRYWSWLLTEEL